MAHNITKKEAQVLLNEMQQHVAKMKELQAALDKLSMSVVNEENQKGTDVSEDDESFAIVEEKSRVVEDAHKSFEPLQQNENVNISAGDEDGQVPSWAFGNGNEQLSRFQFMRRNEQNEVEEVTPSKTKPCSLYNGNNITDDIISKPCSTGTSSSFYSISQPQAQPISGPIVHCAPGEMAPPSRVYSQNQPHPLASDSHIPLYPNQQSIATGVPGFVPITSLPSNVPFCCSVPTHGSGIPSQLIPQNNRIPQIVNRPTVMPIPRQFDLRVTGTGDGMGRPKGIDYYPKEWLGAYKSVKVHSPYGYSYLEKDPVYVGFYETVDPRVMLMKLDCSSGIDNAFIRFDGMRFGYKVLDSRRMEKRNTHLSYSDLWTFEGNLMTLQRISPNGTSWITEFTRIR